MSGAEDSAGDRKRQYDVFLSHNSDDKPVVETLARELRKAGVTVFFDKWDLVPGERWQEALEQALQESATCVVFLGTVGFGDWEAQEMRVALGRRAKDTSFRVIPVFLPGAKPEDLPPFLRAFTGQHYAPADPETFRRLLRGIRGQRPGPSPALDMLSEEDEGPFRGLQYFKKEHARFFCGRDELTKQLVKRLGALRFLILTGGSGSGKSSLIRAGLLPALEENRLPGSKEWPIILMTPGQEPLTGLAFKLAKVLSDEEDFEEFKRISSQLKENHRTLHLVASRMTRPLGPEGRILIIVDQFEELFGKKNSEEVDPFLNNLLEATLGHSLRTKVLISLRSDFYPRAQVLHPELRKRLDSSSLSVGPMSESELRQVIELPAERADLTYEEGLVEEILDEVRDQAGNLPLLEHALNELWKHREGRRLTFEGYEEIRGVEGALVHWAEEAYLGLESPLHQKITRDLFLKLVQLAQPDDSPPVDRKLRIYLDELEIAPEKREALHEVIERMVEKRLLMMAEDRRVSKRTIELAHGTLLRSWPRYRDWLEKDREDTLLGQRIKRRLHDWRNMNRDPDELLRGNLLEKAELWSRRRPDRVSKDTRKFLDISLRHQKKIEKDNVTIQQFHKLKKEVELASLQLKQAELSGLQLKQELEQLKGRPSLPQVKSQSYGSSYWADHDSKDLSTAGWGVIFPPEAFRRLGHRLAPLLKLRQEQAGNRFKRLILKRGESASRFLARHGEVPGIVQPQRVPYFLLLVGGPDEIPFEFQQQLSVQHATGRIHFDDIASYSEYALAVKRAEYFSGAMNGRMVIFSPVNENNRFDRFMQQNLAHPIHARLNQYLSKVEIDWAVDLQQGAHATKPELQDLLSENPPGLLLLNCAGRGYRPNALLQRQMQGALICQGMPGSEVEQLFGAADIPEGTDLHGQIAFLTGGFGLGTPVLDSFPQERSLNAEEMATPRVLSPESFVAALPQRMLSHGALAVLGQIDRKWSTSFSWNMGGEIVDATGYLNESFKRLMRGERLGYAVRPLVERYLRLAGFLLNSLDKARVGVELNPNRLGYLWTAVTDAGNFMILGDPAVRIPGTRKEDDSE